MESDLRKTLQKEYDRGYQAGREAMKREIMEHMQIWLSQKEEKQITERSKRFAGQRKRRLYSVNKVNKPKKSELRSKVYTDRPDYADFDAPAKFTAIQSIIAKHLKEHPHAICSYSGGADSDIMIDLIERTRRAFDLPPVDYHSNLKNGLQRGRNLQYDPKEILYTL